MAQPQLAQSQAQAPGVSTSVRHAVELQKELSEIESRLSSQPELKSKLHQQNQELEKLIKEGKLDQVQADKTLVEIKKSLDKISELKVQTNLQGLVEHASSSPLFSKEIEIPISQLGIKKENVIFTYSTYDAKGLKTWGDFSLSSDGIRTWKDNLMDVSVSDVGGKLMLKVYKGFEGDITFSLNGQPYKVSQKGDVFKSDIAPNSVLQTAAADSKLSQLRQSLPANQATTQSNVVIAPPMTIRSEVKDISVTEIKPGTSLHETLKQAKERGVEVVLTKYAGEKGNVVFEVRKDGKAIVEPIAVARDYNQHGRDYFIERNARIEVGVIHALGTLTDKEQKLVPGTTELKTRMAKLDVLMSTPEMKSALSELEYSNQHSPNGASLRTQWQSSLSSAPIRQLLGLDSGASVQVTPELISKALSRLNTIEQSSELLLNWSKTNATNNIAAVSGFDLNFKIDKPIVAITEAKPAPAVANPPTSAVTNTPATESLSSQLPELAPRTEIPRLVPSRTDIKRSEPASSIDLPSMKPVEIPFEIEFSNPPLQRAELETVMPELSIPTEPLVRRGPTTFEPIVDDSVPLIEPSKTSEQLQHLEARRVDLPRREDTASTLEMPKLTFPDMPRTPDLSGPSLQRVEPPVEMPTIELPKHEPIVNRPAPFSPIEDSTVENVAPKAMETKLDLSKLPAEFASLLTADLKHGELRKIPDTVARQAVANDKIIETEILVTAKDELILRGINPDNQRPVHYVMNSAEGLKLTDQVYNTLTGAWIASKQEGVLAASLNSDAKIFNGSFAESILTSATASVAVAHMGEYFEGTHTAKSHFIGGVTELTKLFYDQSRVQLQFVPSENLVNQHFNDVVAEINRTPGGIVRIPNSSLPEDYNRLGDLCMCCRINGNQPELMIFRSKVDPGFMKTLTDTMKKDGWSVSEEAREKLLQDVAQK